MKYNPQSGLNYLPVNVYILVVVFHWQISKEPSVLTEIFGFSKIVLKLQSIVRKSSDKYN